MAVGPKPGEFKAMISSTALDLPEHRAAVEEACIAAGFFPICMESLPARDATGIAVSLEMVDQADLYLGVYAWRYGWVPCSCQTNRPPAQGRWGNQLTSPKSMTVRKNTFLNADRSRPQ